MEKDFSIAALVDALTTIRDSLDSITPQNLPIFKALCDKALASSSRNCDVVKEAEVKTAYGEYLRDFAARNRQSNASSKPMELLAWLYAPTSTAKGES